MKVITNVLVCLCNCTNTYLSLYYSLIAMKISVENGAKIIWIDAGTQVYIHFCRVSSWHLTRV